MAKYEVDLRVSMDTTIVVEAESEDEAEEKAIEVAASDTAKLTPYDYDYEVFGSVELDDDEVARRAAWFGPAPPPS